MLNQLDTLPEAEERTDQPAVQSPVSPDVPSGAQSRAQSAVQAGDRPADQPVAQPLAPVPLELPFGGKLPPVPKVVAAVSPSAQAIAPTIAQPISPRLSQSLASAAVQSASLNGSAPSSPSLSPAAAPKTAIAPDLPGFPFVPLAATRHATDPALALGILREIEGTLLSWQRELQRLQLEIQELHMEGPIIDGWLESQPTQPVAPPPEAEFIRHAEIDALMGYVETICDTAPAGMIQDTPRAGYRLCGLDADGKVWFRDCPPERVPQVSLAIARCQKVRQLVTRKNDLESRLSKLAEHLVSVHSELIT
ncbi:MAG: hypothetical protein OHK0037_05600 [Elainellaceae cyanobacterium]